ncbi:response regulator [Leptolyngbya ohadii]|uniref:response regulator n=1 Tax=Leptolyngbya ohadii TaxID=1962290 RepID=UPI000B59FC33|nr:response regulator [Leptolyngbya ohadii]
MKVLLVEDDSLAAAVLSEVIAAQQYVVDVVNDGEAGFQLATSWEYDLILLDLLIPKLDGISLCRQLRANGFQKPILLLTAKDSSTDVVKGLDAGADDYVTKPYHPSMLLARMRALLRRGQTDLSPTFLTWEHLCVNPVSAEVTYRGQLLPLSPKEYALLGLFLRHPHRVFSRNNIIDRLWSIDASPGEATVTNLVKDLRRKLKAAGMQTELLDTIYGMGYRLRMPLEQHNAASNQTQQVQTRQVEHERKGTKESKSKLNHQKDLKAIAKVLDKYQNTFRERVAALEQVRAAIQTGSLALAQQQSLAQEAHRLAGTLGSFGYERGSHVAKSLEKLLEQYPLALVQVSQINSLISELTQELAKPATSLSDYLKEETASHRLPPAPRLPVVLVIGTDIAFVEQLRRDASNWNLKVQTVMDTAVIRQVIQHQIKQETPQAIVLHLQESLEAGLYLIKTLTAQFPTVPILVITEQDRLGNRVILSRLGIKRFLHKPIATAEVFQAIEQVLTNSQATDAIVMVLDDDPLLLDTVFDLLQPWGMQVTTLQEPEQFWTVLTATQPDLLVLDVEMPTFNGIDLCRVVRQDPQWGNLPILVVTAHTDIASIHQVFAAGADDFIGKPVAGPELVTRVISRIDRSRLQQELETMKRSVT